MGTLMQKKYIQFLLSINFCLTAITAVANSDDNGHEHVVLIDETPSEPLTIIINQFNQIWECLDKIQITHRSALLHNFILQHKANKETPIQDENLEEPSKEALEEQLTQVQDLFERINAKCQPEGELEETALYTEVKQIASYLETINNLCDSSIKLLRKEEKIFLKDHLEELQTFLHTFINDSFYVTLNNPSLLSNLGNLFHQIWKEWDTINAIHQSESLQSLIAQHKEMVKGSIEDENLEEVSLDTLKHQFTQLYSSLESIRLTYQEEGYAIALQILLVTKENLDKIYNHSKDSLSKQEKAFLKDQLEELQVFLQSFITEILTRSIQHPFSKVQELLDSCKEEAEFLYSQYESVINSEEVNPSDFLTDSQEVEKHFLYFNKNEGLVEILHDGDETYTTTWKVGKADINFVKDWKEEDPITIKKTGLLSKYSMSKYIFGESLDYTISNGKTSARANFVCKSCNQNTYTILAIDYFDNIVVLKNGPCLFVQSGDLKEWHTRDTVVLHRVGSSLDGTNPHKLINTTRTKEIRVSIKKPNNKI